VDFLSSALPLPLFAAEPLIPTRRLSGSARRPAPARPTGPGPGLVGGRAGLLPIRGSWEPWAGPIRARARARPTWTRGTGRAAPGPGPRSGVSTLGGERLRGLPASGRRAPPALYLPCSLAAGSSLYHCVLGFGSERCAGWDSVWAVGFIAGRGRRVCNELACLGCPGPSLIRSPLEAFIRRRSDGSLPSLVYPK
jgi:hypothetical protein